MTSDFPFKNMIKIICRHCGMELSLLGEFGAVHLRNHEENNKMKVRVYEEDGKTIKLKLKEEGNNVDLYGVDDIGNTWYLATISRKGIRLSVTVPPSLGFEMDKDDPNKIKITNEVC